MIIKTASAIHKIVLSALIAFLLLLGMVYLMAVNGISIDRLTLPKIVVEKFYLKLDKKIILKAKKVHIKKTRNKNLKSDVKSYMVLLNYIPKYFQSIEIGKISYTDYNVTFLYRDGIYYIDTDRYQLAARAKLKKPVLIAEIPEIFLKKEKLLLKGRAYFDPSTKSGTFVGEYEIEGVKGRCRLKLKKEILSFFMDSEPFSAESLKKITDKFPINSKIKSWIYEKIVAKSYRLEEFRGSINISDPKFDPKKFEGSAKAVNAKIRFNPKLPYVTASQIDLSYFKEVLSFKLKKPQYQNIPLNGSYVKIHRLNGKDPYIEIVIRAETKVDERIAALLKAYSIPLPLRQQSGSSEGVLKLTIGLKSGHIKTEGVFKAKESRFSLFSIPIGTQRVIVKLKDTLLKIEPSEISIDPILNGFASGIVDLHRKKADIYLEKSRIEFKFDETKLFETKNLSEHVEIDFDSEDMALVILHNLKSKMEIDEENITIKIASLPHLAKYSKILAALDLQRGSAIVNTKNFTDFHIEADIELKNSPLFRRGENIKNFKVAIRTDETGAKIESDSISAFVDGEININVKDYYIKLPDLKSQSPKSFNKRVLIHTANCDFEIKGHTILSEEARAVFEGEFFEIESRYDKSKISAAGRAKGFNIKAENLNDLFVQNFLKIEGIEGGSYSLVATGSLNEISGQIYLENAVLKDLALLNNIMAFLNTIPSLITFADPGYNTKGYKIVKGVIDFELKDSLLIIKALKFDGKSLDITGYGTIDTGNNRVDMVLTLKTLKRISQVINKIPLAGYILLGEEGSISTQIEITGDMIKPDIRARLPQEAIKAPLNIIKRTIVAPFRFINRLFE